MAAAALPGVDELGVVLYVVKDLGVEVEVVDHHVGALEAALSLHRQEPDVAGPRANQVYFSFFIRHEN